MHGLLIVDKPAGITSTDVLRSLGRRLRTKKLGHGGTLDPFATGVLPVLIGQATRLLPYLQGQDKSYRATVRLGVTTDTLDCDGRITAEAPLPTGWDAARLRAELLPRFVGELEQRVPAYAAVRVDGERLYERARRGETVERPRRLVRITALELERCDWPELTVRVACGSGTYIRSLAEDLGEALGTVAHLTALRRLTVGLHDEGQAVPLDELGDGAAVAARLIPTRAALPGLLGVQLDAPALQQVRWGQRLASIWVPPGASDGASLRLIAPDGALVGIGEVLAGSEGVRVVRGFPPGEDG